MKIQEETKPSSLKTRSAWLLFAKVTGFGFASLLPILVVRYLTKEQVGLYRESFLVITNAVTILPLGLSMSAFYYLSREEERRAASILNILIFNFWIGGLTCLALFLFPQLIGNVFQSPELTQLGPRIGVVVWIWLFSTFLETVAIAHQEAKLATVFIILAQFTKTLLMVGAVFLFASVESFIYAAMIQGVLQTVVLLVYLNSRFPRFWQKFDLKFFWEQICYAVPFGLAGILWMLQTNIHNYFVGYKFSSADFAIYAYGCFELPLVAMLAESVTSVLIPRMSELQVNGDKDEMIRLTARAMQKLAFFYFPIYVFMLITARTFIITLFTEDYLASVPIFIINMTILPFSILITDPVVRAYKELGRFLLGLRIVVLIGLVSVLSFGIQYLSLEGMITVAVVALLAEKAVAETIIVRRLGIGRKHLPLLANVGKTAVISIVAGIATYFVYINTSEYMLVWGEHWTQLIVGTNKLSILNFVGGSLVLLISAAVFAPVYIIGSHLWGVIEDGEKRAFWSILSKFTGRKQPSLVDDILPNPQTPV